MIQLSTAQRVTLPLPLHIVDICIEEIVFAGMGETAIKHCHRTLAWRGLAVHKCLQWQQCF